LNEAVEEHDDKRAVEVFPMFRLKSHPDLDPHDTHRGHTDQEESGDQHHLEGNLCDQVLRVCARETQIIVMIKLGITKQVAVLNHIQTSF